MANQPSDAPRWQFWIDVGGTFTDCFARHPSGDLLRHKLLSTGVTKGSVGEGSDESSIVDPLRRRDPIDYWRDYTVRLLDDEGNVLAERTVTSFAAETGRLELDQPLEDLPRMGAAYELSAGEEAPVEAIRYLLGLPLSQPIPPVSVRLGTTRGTNALLTRQGAKTALVTTRGFGDVLHIGYQDRPKLFAPAIEKPTPLMAAVVEIDERVTHEGEVLRAPDPATIKAQLAPLLDQGIESLAVCLLHAYEYAEHEKLVGQIAAELGFDEVSLSHAVAPLIRIVARGDTTVVDGYLNPVLRAYVTKLRERLAASELRLMTSAGGLVDAGSFVGKDSILSGPAGGVVGFSRVAGAAGFGRAIGFDMGGTSTDVARYDGRYELEFETKKAGVRVVAPMMAIETVAAGGGSVCDFDGVKLVVGPASAGAEPGPACYGRGGPLAVTDVNFYLGKIPPERFPFPLDRAAVQRRLDALRENIATATGKEYSREELCDGFLRVANANMVQPIRSISVAKGYDPAEYVLVAFGGAAAQHACAVARELGMKHVLNHPDAGILSAYGMGSADVVRHRARGVYQPYSPETLKFAAALLEELTADAKAEVLSEGISPDAVTVHTSLDLRYRGLDSFLTIRTPDSGDYPAAYAAEHQQLYGYTYPGRELEVVAVRVEVVGRTAEQLEPSKHVATTLAKPETTTTAWFAAQPHETRVFRREKLEPGHVIEGPAIVTEAVSTTVIDPGWRAEVLTHGELVLEDIAGRPRVSLSTERDPIQLEICNNQFAGIAEQMGITLRNTSSSVNVKERLDFSCALFTATAGLVVNAPHIPVHLGAMGETVRQVIQDNPDMQPGDVYVTNDPYRGGSHLPDVTVVTPVHEPESGQLLFFTASRAHHAEIGGIRAGSMPPFSQNLAEEGVLLRNFKLVAAGESRFEELRGLLLNAPFPTRAVEDNLADIAAQVAANNQGVRDLQAMVKRYGLPVVTAYMQHIQAAAKEKMQAALARLPQSRYTFTDHLDDGTPITVTISIEAGQAKVDFTGTGPVSAGNLNANRAIVTAALMYSLRLLIDEDIPLNQGVLEPIELIVPEGLLNPPAQEDPRDCPAVVGGNVETSQRVVDVLLGAFGIAAASQGTMNNTLFGDAKFGYYETVCGGSGATAAYAGADAVHTHMTNTRLTDPEVIERRYPVRVQEFSIRRGSGGNGKHRGGDGIVRKLQFLRPLEVSLLTQRRGPYAPYGLAGGQPGALGENYLHHADGNTEKLAGRVQFQTNAGDVLEVRTPGGGGYGQPS